MQSYSLEQIENAKKEDGEETEDRTYADNPNVFYYQITVTLILVILWITTGIMLVLDSVCLPDQKDRLGVEIDAMATIFSVAGLVGMAGSMIFAVCDDLWKNYTLLLMAIGMALLAVLSITLRFLTDYVAYFALYCVARLILAPIDMIGNAVILRTWGQRASGPLYAIHLGYGLGATISPFLAKPFISPPDANGNLTLATTEFTPTTEPPRFPDGSRIEIPYSILGIFQLAIGAGLLAMFLIGPPKALAKRFQAQTQTKQALKDVCLPSACANGSIPCAVFFLVAFFFVYVLSVGRELGLNLYLYTYAIDSDLGMDQNDAVLLTSVYNAFYMLGRVISVILSKCFTIQVLHCSTMLLVFLAHFGLAVWGSSDTLAFVIFTCGCGLFGSPLWPGQMSWSDQYITMTSTSLFLLPLGGGLGGFVMNPIYGQLLAGERWQGFLSLMLGCAALMLVLVIMTQAAGIRQGTRFPKVVKDDDAQAVYVISFVKQEDEGEEGKVHSHRA